MKFTTMVAMVAVFMSCNVLMAGQKAAPMETKNIVEIAVGAGSFKTLVAAVQAANLVDTLASPGPFTVFAPTDEAFAKLPAGTVESLLADVPALTNILTYHVAGGTESVKSLIAKKEITTVQGSKVTVRVCDNRLYINDSEVIMKPIQASNGVIYVIDAVLLP